MKLSSSGRLTRWALFLQPYQFTIRYKKGKLLTAADAISRIERNQCHLNIPSQNASKTDVLTPEVKSEDASVTAINLPATLPDFMQAQQDTDDLPLMTDYFDPFAQRTYIDFVYNNSSPSACLAVREIDSLLGLPSIDEIRSALFDLPGFC